MKKNILCQNKRNINEEFCDNKFLVFGWNFMERVLSLRGSLVITQKLSFCMKFIIKLNARMIFSYNVYWDLLFCMIFNLAIRICL
jgi:hypothetical protein